MMPGSVSKLEKSRTGKIEKTEIYSLVLVIASMSLCTVFLIQYYWLFLVLAFSDIVSTRYRINEFLALDRLAFAFIVLILTATTLRFGVLEIIIETLALIVLIDFSYFLRQIKVYPQSRDVLFEMLGPKLRSYSYSLLPAGVFSFGMIYLLSSIFTIPKISLAINPSNSVLYLGLASIGVFGVILLTTLLVISSADSPQGEEF